VVRPNSASRPGGGSVQAPIGGAPVVPAPSGPFGVPAAETVSALQTDAYQEIVNKIAWSLGSTYRIPYSNRRSAVRLYAQRIARAVVKAHGYPTKISGN